MRERDESPVLDAIVDHAEMDAGHVKGHDSNEKPDRGQGDDQLEDDGDCVGFMDVTLCKI